MHCVFNRIVCLGTVCMTIPSKTVRGGLPSGLKHNSRWSEVPEYKCLFRYSISTGYLLAVGEVQVWKP